MSPIRLFDRHRDVDFVMFSPSHWIILTIIAGICFILYQLRHTLAASPSRRRRFRVLLAVMLLVCEVGLHVWYLSQGIWRTSSSLPLELCGITLLLSAVMLLTRSRLLYSFLYFAGIGGAAIALLTPNLVYPFPHVRFLLFFVAHGAIIWASLYMTWVEGFRPSWRSIAFTMLILNLAAALVYGANSLLGSNYMFLMHKPNTASVLDFFGPYPYYLLVEEGFALLIFVLMYVCFFALPEVLRRER